MATILGSLLLKITGDTADARQAVDKMEKKAKGFSTFIKGAMGIGGAVIAFRMLKNISKELVAAYSVQETAEAKLQSAITATGKEGSISAEKLFDYASQLQEVTTYGDEATISAAALLQQLGDLSEEGIKQLMPLIQDFASTGLVNLETAASLVGKTLGSTTNALSRYGIVIDATASKEEKLAALTEAMQKKFGGLSKDLAETGTGAMLQLQNAIGDLKEQGGKMLLDFLKPSIKNLTEFVTRTKTAIAESYRLKQVAEELAEGKKVEAVDEIALLQARIKNLEALKLMVKGYKESEAGYDAQIKAIRRQIAALAEGARWEAIGRAAKEKGDKEAAAAAEAEAKRQRELAEWIANVREEYERTDEAHREELETQITYWEWELSRRKENGEYLVQEYRPQIQAILEMLYAQRDAEEEVTQEITDRTRAYEILGKAQTDFTEAQLAAEKALREEQERREEQARALKEEQFDLAASFKELEKSGREWSDFLATTLVDAYGASFEALGAEMVNQGEGWKVFKEAGKEAIASILKAFGIEWAARALAAYAALNFPAGAGYTLASGAAFAGVGVVRALEHGGWINEPVVGRGLETGATYAIAEKRPEYVDSHGPGISERGPMTGDVYFDGNKVGKWFERRIDNRQILLSRGALKG